MTSATPDAARADRQWFIVGRWQEYQAEARANLLRIVAIGGFYAIELINYYGVDLGPLQMPATASDEFHKAVTALAVAWTLMALGTLLALKLQFFPPFFKYATTAGDLLLLTTVLLVADGPRSPLIVGYFLIIALAALRLQLHLVWFASAGSILGYLFVCGYARWYAPAELELAVPRYQEMIVVLGLAMTGIILGQLIRRVRAMAEDYARRLETR